MSESASAASSVPGGLYFEEFDIGRSWRTPGRTVTEADVVNFAGISGDYNRLHLDAEYARTETPFGERVAHGLLGTAIVSGLVFRLGLFEGTLIALLGINWRFNGPIRLGDTIHVEMSVASRREISRPDRGIVVFETRVVNQRGEVVQSGERTLMVARRPAPHGTNPA